MTLGPPLAALATPSAAEQVAEQLALVIARFEDGHRLGSKEEVRAWCGVSVGTFNEALRLLQSRGLLLVRRGPKGGLFTATPAPMKRLGMAIFSDHASEPTLTEAFQIRSALDVLIVADAVRHATDLAIRELAADVEDMYRAAEQHDGVLFASANWSFHERLCALSPNGMLRPLYLGLLDYIKSQTVEISILDESQGARVRLRAAQHQAVLEAIRARDPEAAAAAITTHNAGTWAVASVPGEA